MQRNKLITILTVSILSATIAASIVLMPITDAHTPPWTIPTYSYLVVSPSPVGVGQTIYISYWLDKVPPKQLRATVYTGKI